MFFGLELSVVRLVRLLCLVDLVLLLVYVRLVFDFLVLLRLLDLDFRVLLRLFDLDLLLCIRRRLDRVTLVNIFGTAREEDIFKCLFFLLKKIFFFFVYTGIDCNNA